MTEHDQFEGAVEQFTANPRATKPVETMMQLACEGKSATLRKWAAEWLHRNCNTRVVSDTNTGNHHATAAKATDLR